MLLIGDFPQTIISKKPKMTNKKEKSKTAKPAARCKICGVDKKMMALIAIAVVAIAVIAVVLLMPKGAPARNPAPPTSPGIPPAPAHGTIAVQVRDSATGASLEATVVVMSAADDLAVASQSSASGQATILVSPGNYYLKASAAGYASFDGINSTFSVTAQGTTQQTIRLEPTISPGPVSGGLSVKTLTSSEPVVYPTPEGNYVLSLMGAQTIEGMGVVDVTLEVATPDGSIEQITAGISGIGVVGDMTVTFLNGTSASDVITGEQSFSAQLELCYKC